MSVQQSNSLERNAVIGFALLTSFLIGDRICATNFMSDSNDAAISIPKEKVEMLDHTTLPRLEQLSTDINSNK